MALVLPGMLFLVLKHSSRRCEITPSKTPSAYPWRLVGINPIDLLSTGDIRPENLTQIVARCVLGVQACPMRKTSKIIWQDAQHQVLFEILDLLKEPTADRQVLHRLEEYTRTHFALEEQYMQELGYPGRIEHMQSHARFRKEISELLEDEQELDAIFREIIATFLTEWLTRHVFGIDKKLEEFILQSPAK
jgi:hemerythrin